MDFKKLSFNYLDKEMLKVFGTCNVSSYSLTIVDRNQQQQEELLQCAKKIADKKYSLKIKSSDLAIIDALAKANNMSRAAFLNNVIAQGLSSELKDVSNEAKLLLSGTADCIINSISSSVAWKDNTLGKDVYTQTNLFPQYCQYPADFEPSADYKIFKEKLESSPIFNKNIIEVF